MKNAIVIALALVSVSAFAAKATKEQKACIKAIAKDVKGQARKDAKAACMAATATEAAKMETAPAAKEAAPATK
jgi:hypothetical protein